MAFKFNALTGNLDLVDTDRLSSYTRDTWPDPTLNEALLIYVEPDNVAAFSDGTRYINAVTGEYLLPIVESPPLGSYYQLDGVDEYFTGPTASILSASGATSYSISMTLNFDMSLNDNFYWFSYFDGTASGKLEVYRVNSRIFFQVGSASVRAEPARLLKDYHIVCVLDGSLTGDTNRAKIYIDGVNVTMANSAGIPASIPTSISARSLGVMERNTPSLNPYDGKVKEVSVYNRALLQADVDALYSSGTFGDPTTISGVIASWGFGADLADDETIVNDRVGANDLTPVNMEAEDVVRNLPTSQTLDGSKNVTLVDASSGEYTVLLPAAADFSGRTFTIKKIDSSVNRVIVDANGSDLIDGAATANITVQYESITLFSNGSDWSIL